MNQQELDALFKKALQSTNPVAITAVAQILAKANEPAKSHALVQHVWSLSPITIGGYPEPEEYPRGCTEYTFGVDYAAVQKKLNDLGVANPKLDVDGAWGAKSKAALTAYQKSKGLSADGIPGPITLSSLGISGANDVASSTMGHAMPATNSADAKAYEVAKKGGKEMNLTDAETQYVVTVARGEGGYGAGWAHPSAKTLELSKQFGLTGYEGANSNNWGACQGSGSGGSFMHVDVHADGKPYKAAYRAYKTPEDGFKDMARIILGGGKRKVAGAAEIKAAINKGNLKDAVYAQHANGYFELAPDKYLSAVSSNYAKITNGVGWPKLLTPEGVTQALAQAGVTPAKAGMGLGLILALSGLGVYVFRKQLGLVHA
jgi:peptidoglycan hydrolase-like protein with peptidoglycan-binding domain